MLAIVNMSNLSIAFFVSTEQFQKFSQDGAPYADPTRFQAVEVPSGLSLESVRAVLNGSTVEIVLDETLESQRLLRAREQAVQDAYDRMNAEVYAEMERVYGTKNPESATAFQLTYEQMKANPETWVGRIGFTSVAEVEAYAALKIAASVEYAIWRMERIEQFRVERAAILAGG